MYVVYACVVYACWCEQVTWELDSRRQYDVKSLTVSSYRIEYRLCFSDPKTV